MNYYIDFKEVEINNTKFEEINFYSKNKTKLFAARREFSTNFSKNEYYANDVNLLSLMLVSIPKKRKNIFEILLLYEAKKKGFFPKKLIKSQEEFYKNGKEGSLLIKVVGYSLDSCDLLISPYPLFPNFEFSYRGLLSECATNSYKNVFVKKKMF